MFLCKRLKNINNASSEIRFSLRPNWQLKDTEIIISNHGGVQALGIIDDIDYSFINTNCFYI